MDHAALLLDATYASWPEHRQEAHRALCQAAHHYAGVAYRPGPILDTLAAALVAVPAADPTAAMNEPGGKHQGVRAQEDLAREVLRLPMRDLDESRIALPPATSESIRTESMIAHALIPSYPAPNSIWSIP